MERYPDDNDGTRGAYRHSALPDEPTQAAFRRCRKRAVYQLGRVLGSRVRGINAEGAVETEEDVRRREEYRKRRRELVEQVRKLRQVHKSKRT